MSSKNKDYKLGSGNNSEFLRPNFTCEMIPTL